MAINDAKASAGKKHIVGLETWQEMATCSLIMVVPQIPWRQLHRIATSAKWRKRE
jgi:hypothetical protein